MNIRRLLATAAAFVPLALPVAGLAATAVPNDAFIAGYAAAVLERELSIKSDGITVDAGRITIVRPPLSPSEKSELVKILSRIPGVTGVSVIEVDPGDVKAAKQALPTTVFAVPPASGPAAPASGAESNADVSADQNALDAARAEPLTLYLGVGRTFEPLMADPRWPHFYASYQHYTDDTGQTKLSNVASVGFGETISLIKQSYSSGFRWEAGVQGALFAIFDMDSDSKDLINADYFVGPYVAMRQGNFSLLARVYHQSSHLGDEYLLRPGSDARQNYSFETLNVIASYDLPQGFRIYAGGGYKFDVDPETIDALTAEYGVEWVSPTTAFGTSWIRPVAALDVQNQEEDDWAFSFSARAGVQLEDPARFNQRLQLMFEFYDGNSRNGQFYDSHIQYYGFGLHFYF